jgi:hypothetical protein
MLEGLLTEEKSPLVELGLGIINLDDFSVVMLKGNSSLIQRVPHLVQVTGNAELRWRYAARCLGNRYSFDWQEDPDVLIREGAQYFGAGNHSIQEGSIPCRRITGD